MGNIMDKNNNNKRNEFVPIKSLRKKCIKIYKSINGSDPLNIILNKYSEAIEKDNTNSEIVEKYIDFLYSTNSKNPEPKTELKFYHLFFRDSKKELFNFFERLKNYENEIEIKIDFFQFLFKEELYFTNIEYKNNLPIPRIENNLYYSKLYEHLIKTFYRKYKKETETPSDNLKALFKMMHSDIDKMKQKFETQNIDNEQKILNEETLKELENICCCDFFNIYISKISEFMKKIHIFTESLNKTDISIDEFLNSSNNYNELNKKKYILLENFLYYLEKRPFTIEDNPLLHGEYYIFIDSTLNRQEKIKQYSNKDLIITEKDKDNVEIKYKAYDPMTFNDKLYSIGYFYYKISSEKCFKIFEQKYNFSEYNSNNIFRKNWHNTKAFIKGIFGSKLMKELMTKNDLYDIFNQNNQSIIEEVLQEVYYYPFICKDSVATTNANDGTIYIQGEFNNMNSFEDFIILYCFQIICLMHELFHSYFNTMRYISKEEKRYNSPMPKNGSLYTQKRKAESGEWFEEKFFGKRIYKLTFKESIFILKSIDYNKSLNDFKKEFLNITKTQIKMSDITKYTDRLCIPKDLKKNNIDLDSTYSLNIGLYDIKEINITVGEDVFFYDMSDELEKFKNGNNYLKQQVEKTNTEILSRIQNNKKWKKE